MIWTCTNRNQAAGWHDRWARVCGLSSLAGLQAGALCQCLATTDPMNGLLGVYQRTSALSSHWGASAMGCVWLRCILRRAHCVPVLLPLTKLAKPAPKAPLLQYPHALLVLQDEERDTLTKRVQELTTSETEAKLRLDADRSVHARLLPLPPPNVQLWHRNAASACNDSAA